MMAGDLNEPKKKITHAAERVIGTPLYIGMRFDV